MNLEPAFPMNELNQTLDSPAVQHFGVTVRDYFAAAAIGGLLINNARSPASYMQIATDAYKVADAMMALRFRELP